METIIRVDNISAGYGNRQVLWNISMKVNRGERLLLIGPNGSGKSTLLKVITGIIKPYSGEIFFKGENITCLPAYKRINMGISYLPQTKNIFPSLTVEENLRLACFYCGKNYINSRIDWIGEIFPFLKDKLDRRAGILSGGERQALAAGMALMRDFDVLIADEPTAGLSPKAAKEILIGIEKAQKEMNFTILMVEHNLRYLSEWISRVIVMREGRIIMEENNIQKIDERKLEEVFFQ